MAKRVNDKINYPTNFTSPKTFAVLLDAVKKVGSLTSEQARTKLFPQARSAVSRYDSSNNDTHGEGTLRTYGFVENVPGTDPVEFRISALGNRFLECFDKDETGKFILKTGHEYTFNSILLDALLFWTDSSGKKTVNPGLVMLKLLSDKRLDYYITDFEWAYFCEHSDYRNTGDYEKLVEKLLELRQSDIRDHVQLRNAYVFLVGFSGDWDILTRRTENGYNCFSLKDITKRNLMEKMRRIDTTSCETIDIDEPNATFLSPEWFRSHADEFDDFALEAEIQYDDFQSKFSPDVLSALSGEELLRRMFYSGDSNKENLCYYLEFHTKNRELFGSVAGGSAYKFNLFYQNKNTSWMTGSAAKPKKLTLDEAIVLGTEIRDAIVLGAEIIKESQDVSDVEGYYQLYNKLFAVMGKYINLLWVQKYYHIVFPDMFPVFYNENWQKHVLSKLEIEPYDNGFVRMGQINLFVQKCDIPNVVFAQIIYKYCNILADEEVVDTDASKEPVEDANIELPNLSPRGERVMPLNFILYGAPGTGKTYATAEYAMAIIEKRKVDLKQKTPEERIALMAKYKEAIKAGRITFTTFHQSYGYEDFIQGLRPDTTGGGLNFIPVDGVFKKIADEAIKHGDQDYVIIIDEVNRANISKVFGELITLIEDDKRWGEINALSVTLPSGLIFAVPNNLFIVGTMNSADKSISLIDAALRRRFDFIEVIPNASIIKNDVLKTILERINDELYRELESTDLLVGHAYFMGKTEADLCNIMNHSIIPLLYEYFYDNRNKVKNILDKAIVGYSYQVISEKVGRLRLAIKE